MMKLAKLLALAGLVLGPSAYGGVITYVGSLSGPLESPPNASPGTGFATVTIDTTAQTMQIVVQFTGLLGTTTAAHIHCCTTLPGVGTAGVATTTPAFPGFPIGVTSGSYNSGLLDLTTATPYNPAFVTLEGSIPAAEAALLAGLAGDTTYLNIHTSVVPGGEIRTFLVAIPEPSTVLLLGAGLGGLALLRRKLAA